MANKYIKLDLTTGRLVQQEATATGGSPSYAGQLVALGNDGMLSPTMLGSVGSPTISCVADVNLAAGDFVNLFYSAGARKARKATSVDAVANAQGYVLDSITATASGLVYLGGINSQVPKGSFTTADLGKRVFLSTTAGTVTLTPPSSADNVVQVLGNIIDVGDTLIQIAVDIEEPIVV
jgi:hypothetical protein